MALFQYIVGRFLSYLVVLFVGITITFFLPRFMPSDPVEQYIFQLTTQAGQTMAPEEMAELRETLSQIYGLEGSLLSQYLGFLERVILHFDFGPSLAAFPTPVMDFILRALPWTLGLLVTTTLIAWVIVPNPSIIFFLTCPTYFCPSGHVISPFPSAQPETKSPLKIWPFGKVHVPVPSNSPFLNWPMYLLPLGCVQVPYPLLQSPSTHLPRSPHANKKIKHSSVIIINRFFIAF